ncbi:MAG: hypothetical protein QXN67_08130 [Thermoproteota archaeon]|nr:hypothetical protein [Candidatus Brockarchaeota archaeon]
MIRSQKDRVLRCVDNALRCLGETAKRIIYWYLENEHGLKKEEIPDKPEEFITGLEKIYGSGARVIERLIVSEMADEFGVETSSLTEGIEKTLSK